jgi:ABC-type lipoprotein release transport system permease subunit
LPSQILFSDLFVIGAVAMFICFVVTIYPAILAARANPVEALKNE